MVHRTKGEEKEAVLRNRIASIHILTVPTHGTYQYVSTCIHNPANETKK